MGRLVYACRFDVLDDAGIFNVTSTYSDWIVGHYRDKRKIDCFKFDPFAPGQHETSLAGHMLITKLYEDGDDKSVYLRWQTPDDGDATLQWVNDVHIGQFGNRCSLEHLISIESIEYNIAPARLLFGSPRAIRDVCTKTTACIGEMQIKAEPYKIGADELGDLLTLLNSDLRRLPVVVVSPYAQGDSNKIDSQRLARNLAGVAVVVSIDDPDLTWDFAEEVGRQLSCFNGAARIYWPGFSLLAEPRDHRLFFGAWIDQVGPSVAARVIERTVFAVAAYRYAPNRQISDLKRRVEAAERQKILESKKESGGDFWGDYERDLEQLSHANSRIFDLESENEILRANQKVYFGMGVTEPGASVISEEEEPEISTVLEALSASRAKSKNLIFLDSCEESAKESPFQRPYDIYRALTDLDEIVDDWTNNLKENGSGGDLLGHIRRRGWGKRSSMHISDTSRGKFKSHYEFEYDGQRKLFEPHITIGSGDPNSCASIHFIFDQECSRIVIGHVGKHLPNTKT